MSKSSLGLVAGFVVGAAVAIFTGGVGLAALAAFSVTSAAVNYLMAPGVPDAPATIKNTTTGNRAATGLQLATSAENITVPVAFGSVKLSGNFIHYDRDTFKATPIIEYVPNDRLQRIHSEQNSGGKGGGPTGDVAGLASPMEVLSEKDVADSGMREWQLEAYYDERVVGYRYSASFDYGICMGEVLAIDYVYTNPGEQRISSYVGGFTASTTTTTITKPDVESGTIRFYSGSQTQTRDSGDAYNQAYANHRGVCFAAFNNFQFGINNPTPKTYTFRVQRYPVAKRTDGTTVSGLQTRGASTGVNIAAMVATSGTVTITTTSAHGFSNGDAVLVADPSDTDLDGTYTVQSYSTTQLVCSNPHGNTGAATGGTVRHHSYYDANPAAVLWETFVNDIWGRGLNSDLLHEASFIAASDYCRDNHIGMSFTMDAQDSLKGVVDAIREHCSIIPVWDGQKMRLVMLSDSTEAYTNRVVINEEQVNDVQFSRPSWASTFNEVRCEFTNRLRNHQTEIAVEQDLASVQALGRVNSTRVSLRGFSTRSVAERQAKRLLEEVSYPKASLRFKMNRFASYISPGAFVEFVWSEWSAGEMHTFWRVAAISDENQDEQGIEVTLVEDQWATAYEGAQEAFATPEPVTVIDGVRDPAAVELSEEVSEQIEILATDITSTNFLDSNILQTGGISGFNLFVDSSNSQIISAILSWKRTTEASYKSLIELIPWAAVGELTTAKGIEYTDLNRGGEPLKFKLDDETTHETAMLSLFSKVTVDGDDIGLLPGTASSLMFVGDEVFYVGEITDSGATDGGAKVFDADNYLRAQFGTDQAIHADGTKVILVPVYSRAASFAATSPIPTGEAVDLRLTLVRPGEVTDVTVDTTNTFDDRGTHPLAPEPYSVTKVSDDWTVSVRPRFHNGGFGLNADLNGDLVRLNTETPSGYTWHVEPRASGASNGDTVDMGLTFAVDDGTTQAAGLASGTWAAPSGTDELHVYQAYNGILSESYISLTA